MSSTEAGPGTQPDRLAGLLAEHASLEKELADPAVHADQSRARRLGRRYAQLAPLVETARALDEARGNPEPPPAAPRGPAATSRPPASSPRRTPRSPWRRPRSSSASRS